MSKGRILIVEDNMDTYELMRFVLERHGYETFLAANGRDGVNAARFQLPDLILMDMAMPEMNGWEATRRIKSDDKTKTIPLIAVSARALPQDQALAQEAGCDEYIVKPMDLLALVEVVKGALEERKT